MKIGKKLLLLSLSIFLFAGCNKDQESSESLDNIESNEQVSLQAEESAENPQEIEDGEILIVDSVGREVKLPKKAEKVISEGPFTTRLYTYIARTENLMGVSPREQSPDGRPYALANPKLCEIKHFGGNNNIENYEEVLLEKPDVFFAANKTDKADYDKIQEQIGCPVIALDSGKDAMFDERVYESIKIIGKAIGKEDRAQEVVDYMESIKKDLDERTKDIKKEDQKLAYAGGIAYRGAHELEATRANYQLFDTVNVKNVAQSDQEGLLELDKEQLIEWDPEYIFIDLASIYLIQDEYNSNPKFFESLSAFKNNKVYAQMPYVWCHINYDTAMADAYFVGKTCYPDKFEDIDVIEKTNEIYQFLVGDKVYEELAKENFGGFQKITLEDFKENKFLKKEE